MITDTWMEDGTSRVIALGTLHGTTWRIDLRDGASFESIRLGIAFSDTLDPRSLDPAADLFQEFDPAAGRYHTIARIDLESLPRFAGLFNIVVRFPIPTS